MSAVVVNAQNSQQFVCADSLADLVPGTTTAIWETPTAADFVQARQAGVEWVEVALNQCYRNVSADEVLPRMQAMKASLDSAGMKVWSIHLPFSRTLDISVTDEERRMNNVQIIARIIEQCAMFNPQRLVLHPGSEPIDPIEREARIENAIRSISALRGPAGRIGAVLCIENLPRTCPGNTPEELVRIVDAVPGVMICFDMNHYQTGTNEYFLDVVGSRIGTIHALDYDGSNECHWLPGQGEINWPVLVRRLRDGGYKGVFMYEAIRNRNDGSLVQPTQIVSSFNKLIK